MKVLVVGGGGREHAIVQKLRESKEITALYCAPGNGGIARDAVCVPIKATDVEAIADWAAAEKMDWSSPRMTRCAWDWWTCWRRAESPLSGPTRPRPASRAARSLPRT